MHRNSELLFKKYAAHLFLNGMRILEIGPDHTPSVYEEIVKVNINNITWETLDIANSGRTTYNADSDYAFPIPDSTFDIVLSGQVIEHVRQIWVWMKELSRVCKPGGLVITINPVNWPYHEAPSDCWRIYPAGMRALYSESGLEVILCERASLDIKSYSSLWCKNYLNRIINSLLDRKPDWSEWMAEDVITVGRKEF